MLRLLSLLLQVHSNGACLDDEILADPEIQEAIKNEGKVHREFDIVNTDRATLGRLGGAIAKQHGDSGFAGQISIDFKVCYYYSATRVEPGHYLTSARASPSSVCMFKLSSMLHNLVQGRQVCFRPVCALLQRKASLHL